MVGKSLWGAERWGWALASLSLLVVGGMACGEHVGDGPGGAGGLPAGEGGDGGGAGWGGEGGTAGELGGAGSGGGSGGSGASAGTGGSGGAGASAGTGGSGGKAPWTGGTPELRMPRAGIGPTELALLVNLSDPQSVAVAAHYQAARGIPAANVIELDFDGERDQVGAEEFGGWLEAIEGALPAGIEAYAVSWTRPSRVECMSITSALAFGGFDQDYCRAEGASGCIPTKISPLFESWSTRPYTDHGVRPAMMLGGASSADVIAMIDRGVASDGSHPTGHAWYIRTNDTNRAVRHENQAFTANYFDREDGISSTFVDNSAGGAFNAIEDEEEVLFYFTGLKEVPKLASNTFLPGAVGDHLTSFGGALPQRGGQMNFLSWVAAGITATYGTVVEPCNYQQKFPVASVFVPNYFRGGTVLESYWKSVQMPGEGLFVGEPLASPWGVPKVDFEGGKLRIETTALIPNQPYELHYASSEEGPWSQVPGTIQSDRHRRLLIEVEPVYGPIYELRPISP